MRSSNAPSQQQGQCGEALQRARGRNPGEPGPERVGRVVMGRIFARKFTNFARKAPE